MSAQSLCPAPRRVATVRAPVLSHAGVNAEYRLIEVEVGEPVRRCAPGQFFHILCPQSDELRPFLRRPMSLHRIDGEAGRLGFLYKVVGDGTRALATLAPGDALDVVGPLGVGFTLPDGGAPIVMLGRGVGLATLAPLARFAKERGHAATAILSARRPDLLMAIEELSAAGADVHTVTDSEGTSSVEQVEARIEVLAEAGRLGAVYVCGSNRLIAAAQRVAARHGSFGQVAMEQQMACGLGVCFCCVRPFRVGAETVHRRVCCEGPVFDLQEAVAW